MLVPRRSSFDGFRRITAGFARARRGTGGPDPGAGAHTRLAKNFLGGVVAIPPAPKSTGWETIDNGFVCVYSPRLTAMRPSAGGTKVCSARPSPGLESLLGWSEHRLEHTSGGKPGQRYASANGSFYRGRQPAANRRRSSFDLPDRNRGFPTTPRMGGWVGFPKAKRTRPGSAGSFSLSTVGEIVDRPQGSAHQADREQMVSCLDPFTPGPTAKVVGPGSRVHLLRESSLHGKSGHEPAC